MTGPGVSGSAVRGPLGYEDLVTAATVGLDRARMTVTALAGPAGAHAGVLDRADPAGALLDAAALLSSARRAGVAALSAGPVTAAPPDTGRELSRAACLVVFDALRGQDPALAADLLEAAATAGFRAPAPVLPLLLDAAVRDRWLRAAVSAVLGERGRWLAAHRTDWQRVADTRPLSGTAAAVGADPGIAAGVGGGPADLAKPADAAGGSGKDGAGDQRPGAADAGGGGRVAADEVWLTGRFAERRDWLAGRRHREPDAARELLAAGWSRETGDDRAELLATLAIGLAPADGTFLEAALDDRKGAVRAVAARLLARLPDSAYVRRAVERGAGTLRVDGDGRRVGLVVTLPDAYDAAAARDGLSTARPSPAVGTRAWLATQLIAAVPLREWTARLGLHPEALTALPVAGGLRIDVHAGWRLAAVAQRDQRWAAALLDASLTVGDLQASDRPAAAWPDAADLAAVLPPGAALARAGALLARLGPTPEVTAILAAHRGAWPPDTADQVLTQLAVAVGAPRPSRDLAVLITAAGRLLPAGDDRDYAVALRDLAAARPPVDRLANELHQAADIIGRRRYFLRELR